MADTTPVTILPGTLGYTCYPTPQELNNDIITNAQAFIAASYPGIWVDVVEPPPDRRNNPWFHTTATRWYYYINGVWQRVYDISPSSKFLMPFWGSASDVDTEGGGSPGAVGVSTGPLWVIDSTMEGRALIGAGTVPGTTTPVVTTSSGDTGGEGQHVQTAAEVGQHTHPPLSASSTGFIVDVPSGGGGTNVAGALEKVDATTGTNADGGQPMSLLQPYKAGYWLRRTSRLYVQPPY